MTKRKLITLKTKALWQSVVQLCIDALMREEPRTDNQGARAKVRVRMPKSYKCPVKMPKYILVEETDEYIVKEYRAFFLLDWLRSVGLSDWNSKDIYKKRQRLLMTLAHMEKDLNGETWLVRKELDKELEDV